MKNIGGNWSDILDEMKTFPSSFDDIRHRYFIQLQNLIDRNIICYYSGWQQNKQNSITINDEDMTGFMTAMKGIDKSKGVTLILHTPGGDPNAAESIVAYLRKIFNDDIEVIVPHMAMSAGTMIACASKSITMGYHSSLGPVDPQLSGLPAYAILSEFEEAYKELQNDDSNINYWSLLLSKYPPAFVKIAQDAVNLSDELLARWLGEIMFKNDKDADQKISRVTKNLNEHENSKVHSRHFNYNKAKEFGLKVKLLEDDPHLQNAVLSLHHAFIITLQETNASKIIEGSKNSYINFDN
ncbi:serine protease [Campylobacter jejuni]|nr:serine protease [Campylobacter jejuni]